MIYPISQIRLPKDFEGIDGIILPGGVRLLTVEIISDDIHYLLSEIFGPAIYQFMILLATHVAF